MKSLSERIIAYAAGLPEGTPVVAKSLLHLGSRAAVDQTLSRLVRRGRLLRAGRGMYVLPIDTRYGVRAPSAKKVIEAIANQRGEAVASSGAAAANALGLSPQVPMRTVYLTSGRSRKLKLGAQIVELKHAPSWQLAMPNRQAGEAVRALAWLGPTKTMKALQALKRKLPEAEFKEIVAARALLPSWIAQPISKLFENG